MFCHRWLGSIACLVLLHGIAQPQSDEQISCESPALQRGAFHIVVAGHEAKTCFMQYLWHMGLSNSNVYIYRRVVPERPLSQWQGPCGTEVHERLLLPNRGYEAAAFHSYVLEHWANPPEAMLFLHGHGPHSYHTSCETVVGRARLFYRGLATPEADNDASEFAQNMVSLTRLGDKGDKPWLQYFRRQHLEPMTDSQLTPSPQPEETAMLSWQRREEQRMQARRQLSEHLHMSSQQKEEQTQLAMQRCQPIFDRWDIQYNFTGFYTCCASFILPWGKISELPMGFYEDMLYHARIETEDLHPLFTAIQCFEYSVFAWYNAPALSPGMKRAYLAAADEAQLYNLSSCAGIRPPTC